MSLALKLHPNRFTAMSSKMAAIVGYVLDKRWTEPRISELAITSDGYVLAGHIGDIGLNDWIGSAEDLERNVENLLNVADLTETEKVEWYRLYHMRIKDWRKR